MLVITSGESYIDIDAYACGVAYSVLKNAEGEEAIFASSSVLNGSVPDYVLSLGFKVERNYTPKNTDKFIIVDLSIPEKIDHIANQENIVEVIDHHTGYEKCWENCKSQIEFIGAAATIIFERFIESGRQDLLTPNLCKLLACAILDNTLNLKSSLCTARDISAFETLQKLGGFDESISEEYFGSCEKEVKKDLIGAVKNDIKFHKHSSLLPGYFGQLTLLDTDFVLNRKAEIQEFFNGLSNEWMFNLIDLKDGKSYIFAGGDTVHKNLEKLLGQKFENDILVLPKFLLRKQIIKLACDLEASGL